MNRNQNKYRNKTESNFLPIQNILQIINDIYPLDYTKNIFEKVLKIIWKHSGFPFIALGQIDKDELLIIKYKCLYSLNRKRAIKIKLGRYLKSKLVSGSYITSNRGSNNVIKGLSFKNFKPNGVISITIPDTKNILLFAYESPAQNNLKEDLNNLGTFVTQISLKIKLSKTEKELEKLKSREEIDIFSHNKRNKKQLELSEQTFLTLFETMSYGVVYQGSDGAIISANKAAERILGLSLAQMQGRTSLDPKWRSIKEDGSDFPGNEHPAMIALKTGKEVRNKVMGVYNPKIKKYTWININAVPQFLEGQNKPFMVYATFEDITESKKIKEEITKAREEWQDIFEAIGQPAFILDPKFKIIAANKAVSIAAGKPIDKLIGMPCYKIFHGENSIKSAEDCPVQKLLSSGTFEVNEMFVEALNGTYLVACTPVFDESNKLEKIIHIATDVTENRKIADNLRKSEAFHRRIIENAAGVPFRVLFDQDSGEGRYDYVGPGIENLFEIPLLKFNEINFNKMVMEVIPRIPGIPDNPIECRKQMLKGNIPQYNVDLKIKTKTGYKWINDSSLPIKDDTNNRIIGAQGILVDITDRKTAEQLLQESEKKFRNIIESSPLGMHIYKLSKNKLYFVGYNPAANKMLGVDHEKFMHKTIEQAFPPLANTEIPRKYKEVCKKGTTWYNEQINYKDKEIRGAFEVTAFQTAPNTMAVMFLDVTDRIIAQTKLKESEEKFRSIFAESKDAIYITTRDGKFIDVNKSALELLEFGKNEIRHKSVTDFYSNPNDRSTFRSQIEKYGFVKDFSLKLVTNSGKEINCLLSATVRKDEHGEIEGYQGIIRDITQEKKAEQALIDAKTKAEKADKLKSEFLAQMSHEIRTPINTILSFMSLIQNEIQMSIPEDLQESFPIIDNASKRIIRTIDLILNMSELQTGTYDLRINKFDLLPLLKYQLFREYQFKAKSKGIELKFENGQTDYTIEADEYTVNQIFANLIDNAIKYTKEGSVTIKLKKDNQGRTITEIIDTGVGIAEEYIPSLFDPFSQEEMGYTRKYEGNGLGLALVKKYCELNNASISVKSQKRKGSKFSVRFN